MQLAREGPRSARRPDSRQLRSTSRKTLSKRSISKTSVSSSKSVHPESINRSKTVLDIAGTGRATTFGAVKIDGALVDGNAAKACELLGITKRDLKRFKKRFDKVDVLGKDEITKEEFFLMLGVQKDVFTESLFAFVDTNKSNTINFSEMVQVLTTYCIYTQEEIFDFVFQRFDLDGSGSLDEFEFIEMIAELNARPMFPGNLQRTFESFDTNGDGLIEMEEFMELNRKFPMLMFPAFRLQDVMQKKTLGIRRWTQILRERNKRQKIEQFKAENRGLEPPGRKSSCCTTCIPFF